jgi:hypothetical protein
MAPDTGMDRERSMERTSPDVLRTTARRRLSPVVVRIAAAGHALAGRPLHSKRAVRKPRNKSYGACVNLRAMVRRDQPPSTLEAVQRPAVGSVQPKLASMPAMGNRP